MELAFGVDPDLDNDAHGLTDCLCYPVSGQMNFRIKLLFIMLASLIASGCGSPGEPLPPSLELPRPVIDLRAVRKGNAVTLTWTLPTLTTEGRTVTQSGNFEVCRALTSMQHCDTPVARIPVKRLAHASSASQTETYVDVLPAMPGDATADFYYAVSAVNSYGKTAGLSNQVTVPAAPTLPPPAGLTAQVTAAGIRLSWQAVATTPQTSGLRFLYRVYRRELGTKADVVAGELPIGDPSPSLLDHSFEWEKTYDYWVSAVTIIAGPSGEQQVDSDDSALMRVTAHDVFPPATPTGLQAVFSGPGQKPFVDLIWNANTEPDLAGYNIYRHEAGTEPRKLNQELVKTPAFRDTAVLEGHEYSYSVSAVDVRGNESSRSEEANEAVPAQ